MSALKLVTSKKQSTVSPVVNRRLKLLAKVQEQIELCTAKKEGNSYAPKRLKTFTVAFPQISRQIMMSKN